MKTNLTILFILFAVTVFSQESPDKIYEKINGAVVIVHAYDLQGNKAGSGSGVILNEMGIAVTAFHVIAGADKIELKKNDVVIPHSGITGINVEKDIAILKITDNSFPSINLAPLNELKVGQKIYAIGSPMSMENTISEGIISGFREIGKDKQKFIQITAGLGKGSSGGAVVNANGELIGISTMKLIGGDNLNFAVTADDILKVNSGETMSGKQIKSLMDFYRGYDAAENGSFKEAVKWYSGYIEVFPNDPKGYNYRGVAYHKLKQYENAIKDFTFSLRLDKNNTAAYMNRGEAYFQLEKNWEAIRDFTEVIRIEPVMVDSYYARGLAYMSEKDWSLAIKDFTKVINMDRGYVNAYVNRGLCYYNNEDYEYCMNDWQRAINLDPSLSSKLRPLINVVNEIDRDR